MKSRIIVPLLLGVLYGIVRYFLFGLPAVPADVSISQSRQAIDRGAYLVTAGGCGSCHRGQTEGSGGETGGGIGGEPGTQTGRQIGRETGGQTGGDPNRVLSGGLAMETDFGTFYAPNITPDVETGIGAWNAQDFLLALQHGRTPDGSFYYPAFPYRAYAGLTDEDVLDMAAYLMSLEPVRNTVPDPEIPGWLMRSAMAGWNWLADILQREPEQFDPDTEPLPARGAYLARNLGHCGECHTPRNWLGIPDYGREYAGAELGEESIEPIDAEALAEWTFENFDMFLLLGMKPDFEFVGGDMNEVIEHNTSKLTEQDRDALAAFFTRHSQ